MGRVRGPAVVLALPTPPLAREAVAAAADQVAAQAARGPAAADLAQVQARTGRAQEVAVGPDLAQAPPSHLARCRQRVLQGKRIPTRKVVFSLRSRPVHNLARSP